MNQGRAAMQPSVFDMMNDLFRQFPVQTKYNIKTMGAREQFPGKNENDYKDPVGM